MELTFPALRSVLYDRTPNGPPTLKSASILVPYVVPSETVRRLSNDRVSRLRGRVVHRPMRDSRWYGGNFGVDFFAYASQEQAKNVKIKAVVSSSTDVAVEADWDALLSLEAELCGSRGAFDCTTLIKTCPILVLPSKRVALAVVPDVDLEFTKLGDLALLESKLTQRLKTLSDTSAFGFLTLTKTRKLVPLLENDPASYELPLVGIWLTNVENVDAQIVYRASVAYLTNEYVSERVSPPEAPDAFVIVLMNRGQSEFYECRPKAYGNDGYMLLESSLEAQTQENDLRGFNVCEDVDLRTSFFKRLKARSLSRSARLSSIGLDSVKEQSVTVDQAVWNRHTYGKPESGRANEASWPHEHVPPPAPFDSDDQEASEDEPSFVLPNNTTATSEDAQVSFVLPNDKEDDDAKRSPAATDASSSEAPEARRLRRTSSQEEEWLRGLEEKYTSMYESTLGL